MNKKNSSISSRVMERIRDGDVTMKHRSYFLVGTIASLIAALVLGMLSAYAFAILFLWLRIVSADTMAIGAKIKLSETIGSFPWWAVFILALSIPLIVVVLRRIGHMYRISWLGLTGGIIITGVVLGMVLVSTGFLRSHEPGLGPRVEGDRPGTQQRLHAPRE